MIDSERLNLFLASKKVSTAELAQALGVSHAAVSQLRSGKNHMSSQVLEKLLDIYPDLCPKWLIKGEGDMVCGHLQEKGKSVEETSKDAEIMYLKKIIEGKDEVIGLLKKMVKNQNV